MGNNIIKNKIKRRNCRYFIGNRNIKFRHVYRIKGIDVLCKKQMSLEDEIRQKTVSLPQKTVVGNNSGKWQDTAIFYDNFYSSDRRYIVPSVLALNTPVK